MKKYKINYKKLSVAIIVILLIIFSIITTIAAFATPKTTITGTFTYVVRQGDTYWSVAKEHCSQVEIQRAVYDLEKINQTESGDLQIGQAIQVPIYETHR